MQIKNTKNTYVYIRKSMDKLKYIAYYSDPSIEKKRKAAPSADTKVDYLAGALKKIGYDIKVISKCGVGKCNSFIKYYDDYTIEKNGIPVRFVPELSSKFRSLRFFARKIIKHNINDLIKEECLKSDCKIVIYHSLGMYDIIRFLKKHKKPFTLEVEEIYSDVMTKNKKPARKKEDYMFSSASSYIFSTELLNKEINKNHKPYAICNGTYRSEPTLINEKIFDDKDKIHCVYAGTLDPRKGGAIAAVASAEFLDSNYHIHILGFGNDEETRAIKDLVLETAEKSSATVMYDGLLSGEEYIRFIQSCDIGLSTQNPDAAFNSTSFPSKILSYMANGLRVVSVRIPATESSAIGEYMYYYDQQTPEEIAKAIKSVNIKDDYDGRNVISHLDVEFQQDVAKLLESE